MPKQPVAGLEVTDNGVNSCGIMACLNFRRFLHGMETHAPTRRLKRGSAPEVAGDWVQAHMSSAVSPVVMECARAHGMRHLLSAAVSHGGGVSQADARAILKDAYQAWYVSVHA